MAISTRRMAARLTRSLTKTAGILMLASLAGAALSQPSIAQPKKSEDASPPLAAKIKNIEVQSRQLTKFGAKDGQSDSTAKLVFRGGLLMSSADPAFGGWSGFAIEPDGTRFLAISDEGHWMAGEIGYAGNTPVGLVKTRIGPIVALRGRTLDRKRDLDAEAISPASGSLTKGTVLVAFERRHRIGVFSIENGALLAPQRYLKLPAEARQMKGNEGFEAVVKIQGGPSKGAVLAFSERFPGDPKTHTGWIWLKNEPHRLSLVDHGGFNVTDVASLADGRLILLERRFRWTEGVKMRVRLIEADAVKPGAVLDGQVLLETDQSSEIDNMEAIAVHRDGAGETVLTVLSDNNFNTILQRNLLLQFTLREDRLAVKSR